MATPDNYSASYSIFCPRDGRRGHGLDLLPLAPKYLGPLDLQVATYLGSHTVELMGLPKELCNEFMICGVFFVGVGFSSRGDRPSQLEDGGTSEATGRRMQGSA